MKQRIGRFCVLLAAMGGCASSSAKPQAAADSAPAPVKVADAATPAADRADMATTPPPSPYAPERVIASVKDGRFVRNVTMEQFLKPLIEAHGLNTLLVVMQLELAKELAKEAGVSVTENDVKAERELTLGRLFQENDEKLDAQIALAEKAKKPEQVAKLQKQKLDDRDMLLKQFLEQQRISPSELDLVFRTTVYLRKLAEPTVGKQIKEEDLQREFSIRYNEKVQVWHIQFNRAQEAIAAKARLQAGEPFEQLARELSTNQATAPMGGKLTAFSREDIKVPQTFRDIAFSLKEGDISDPVEASGSYHLIKVGPRISQKLIKYEDVKEALRADLTERVTQAVIGQIRAQIGDMARQSMTIYDPVLEKQFQEKLQSFKDKAAAAEKARTDMELERLKNNPGALPATAPTTMPTIIGPAVGAAPTFGEQPATRPATAPAAPAPAANATKPAGPSTGPVGAPK